MHQYLTEDDLCHIGTILHKYFREAA